MSDDFSQFTKDWVERELGPLFEQAGGSAHVVSIDGDRVTLAFRGALAGAPGARYIAEQVIRPALNEKLGRSVDIEVVPQVWIPERVPAAKSRTKK